MSEELEKKRKNDLYSRMSVVRLAQVETFGDRFRYVRGKGMVKRDREGN